MANITGGAKNETTKETLRKHFPHAFTGKAWTALVEAIASGDEYVRSLAKAAYDQLFTSRAAGKYLDVQGKNVGIDRPVGVGMDDESYRKFIIALSNKKLTVDALLEMLEVFYGTESVRAFFQTGAAEPYSLTPATTMRVVFEEQDEVRFYIDTNDYQDTGAATADEVAAAFTRQAQEHGCSAFAEGYTDYLTGQRYVRFYSGARGVRGSIRVIGGCPASSGKFNVPGIRAGAYAGDWTLTKTGKTARLTTAGAAALDWRAGDGLTLHSGWEGTGNEGSYIITKVYQGASATYVEYENELAVEGVFSLGPDTFAMAPVRHLADNDALVALSRDGFRVWMPVTTNVVKRTEKTAAYLATQSFKLSIDWARASILGNRILVELTAPGRTFVQDEKVFLDGLTPTDMGSGLNYWPGGKLNGLGTVAIGGVDGCTVDMGYGTPAPTATENILLIVSGATISSTVSGDASGPYVYEPRSGLAVTGTSTTTSQAIAAGQSFRLLPVANIADFPESTGWIAVGFGFDYQTEAIRYLGKTAGGLLIEPSYRFPKAIPQGASVILLAQRDAWQPSLGQYDDELTLTNSGVGLAAAEAAIDAAKAAGVALRKRINYPPRHGLGGIGGSTEGEGKLSDVVRIYGGDDVDAEVEKARQR